MRVHIQSYEADPAGVFTREQWLAAFGETNDLDVSFGYTVSDFRAVERQIEILLAATRGLRELLPFDAPNLKLVSVASAGVDMLAPFDWLPPGALLLNNSGTHSVKVAEYALMGLLMLANQMPVFIKSQECAEWQPASIKTLGDGRLTVVGLGAIGERCATVASAMGMRVIGIRPEAGSHPACEDVVGIDQLERVLPESDYVVVSLPGGDSTRHFMNRRRLELLPRGAGLVNVGRGSVIDEVALCDLLDDGHLGGAVLDVFEQEPLTKNSRVWRTKNLIATPHISADDKKNYNRLTLRIFAENLAAYREGRAMPNLIDLSTGLRANQ